MAEPVRKLEDDNQNNQPFLRAVPSGGQSTPDRTNLKLLNEQESNPEQLKTGSVEDQESNGSNIVQSPWANNTSRNTAIPKSAGGILAFAKKKGPLVSIIAILITMIISITGLSLPVFLTQSIMANLVQKFNIQETSLTIRTNKLIASKMVNNATSGYCGSTVNITILCKFTRPSNRFLTQLEKNGIKALDEDGNVIAKNSIFPNTRPATYSYIDSTGNEIKVEAKNLYTTLLDNSSFRASFHNATQTRFMSLADSVFGSIKTRLRFNTSDKLSGTTDENSLNKEINNDVKASNGVKAAAAESEAAAETAAKNIIQEEVDGSVAKISNAGKASVINLAAAGVCFVTDLPGLATKAGRAFQMAQLVQYSMIFLSAFGSIKAGDATPQEVSAIGDTLTKVVNGKSAMDSFGMRYSINGDTKPLDNNYKKFAPGGNMSSALSSTIAVTESPLKRGTCNVATNPFTGAAVDVALVDSIAGIPLAIANAIAGNALAYVVGTFLPPVLNGLIKHINMKGILTFFYGDLTQNLSGESVGDALVSGASHVMGQTANAGGNMPLTPAQAVAYDNTTKEVQLAYAEEDRATKSPFDTSSPNTMLGSIVQHLIPYYTASNTTTSSITNTFSFMGKVIMGSFSTILQPLSAKAVSTDQGQYQLCDDPTIKADNIAAGPYCNIIYGIPPEYLDEDPITVVNDLVQNKDIDVNTGDPITGSKLDIWTATCTDGKTDQAKNCQITDQKSAEYALYTIDHRIQKSMDETQ